MVTAPVGTSQGHGRQPSGLSSLQRDEVSLQQDQVPLLLPKLRQDADAIAAGWPWTAPAGLVPIGDHTQPYASIPAEGPALLILQEKEHFENAEVLQLVPGKPCAPR